MRVLRDWLLTPERVAIHEPSRTAVVADMHLGYAEARRRRGEAVPPESTFELLQPLRRVVEQRGARRLVVAGDLLEDAGCLHAFAEFVRWCREIEIEQVALVPGNHDTGLEGSAPASSPLTFHPDGFLLESWRIVHGEGLLPEEPVVQGHEHPWLRWSPKSRAIRPRFASRLAPSSLDGPCYLSEPGRLILPAYSLEAAGANVLSARRWRSFHCHIIAGANLVDLRDIATLSSRLSLACGVERNRKRGSVD
jgi:metallophosphoesterase superfamily enzyme